MQFGIWTVCFCDWLEGGGEKTVLTWMVVADIWLLLSPASTT